MPLSTNTLMHFTENKSALKGILTEYFKVYYCLETTKLNSKGRGFYVPMVSFCDIPLSQVKDHLFKYGHYGLGMTREWAAKNGLNPVLYIGENSTLSESLRVALPFYIRESLRKNSNANEAKSFLDLLRYSKNYEGELKRKNGETTPNYRYADEREWRYVPHYTEDILMIIPEASDTKKLEDNQKKLDSFRLKFEPNDIKYIFIQDESEIPEFVDHLKTTKNLHLKANDIELLISRIITTQQIMADM